MRKIFKWSLIFSDLEGCELLHLRNIKAINENVMRLIERELDFEEVFVRTFKTY